MSGLSDAAGLVADISHYQTSVDFAAMAAGGIAAVILKASQGTIFTDPTFAARAVEARMADRLVGAYHFFNPGVDAVAQAKYFLGIAMAAGVKTLAVDFEPPTAGEDEDGASILCQTLKDDVGSWPLLYTGKWEIVPEDVPKLAPSWKAYGKRPNGRIAVAPTHAALLACPLWHAEWTTAETPNLPPGFTTWALWQFESVLNAVPGVAGPASRSRVNGTLADLQKFWSGTVPPTDKILESFVDQSGKTHQIIDRVISAASTAISGAVVSAFVGLAVLGCVRNQQQQEPPTKHQVAASSPLGVYGVDWRIGRLGAECRIGSTWEACQ